MTIYYSRNALAPPAAPPVLPPVAAPVLPPVAAPVLPPVAAPVLPPVAAPVLPPVAATTGGMLFAARALQGACGALMAPAALSLLSITFTESRERARAFGVFGAIAGGGGAVGLLLGGALTEYASWRWTLLISTPIAVLAALAAYRFVGESRATGDTRYDLPGACTATAGLVALVYGFTRASTDGWG